MHLHQPRLSSVQRPHQSSSWIVAPRKARPFRSLCRAARTPSLSASSSEVRISYVELLDPNINLNNKIRDAFGPSGLGIVIVYGVPGYEALRKKLLPLAEKLWGLPMEVLAKYVDPGSRYSVGLSRGRKGHGSLESQEMASFYANTLQDAHTLAPELIAAYPAFYSPNLWPDKLPELEQAFKDLSACIIDVGVLVAGHCSRYVQQELLLQQQRGGADLPDDHLKHLDFAGQLAASNTTKGRLIHYPPPSSQASAPEDSSAVDWCGRHRDFGSLTGLTAPMYLQASVEVPVPDPAAGLYVETPDGSDVQVIIPADYMAFQIGRVMGIQSGGVLRPTRHFVRAPAAAAVMPAGSQQGAAGGAQGSQVVGGAAGVSRNTLAVFMQPRLDARLVAPKGADALRAVLGEEVVGDKWEDGMTFGDFAKKELAGS